MASIFINEEQVIEKAEALLTDNSVHAVINASSYSDLLEEYKKQLKQIMKMVKMADLMQLELKTVLERLEAISNIDVLTGLFNRRFFNLNYFREWNNAARTKTTLACIMVDIDYFKKYNDTYGHLQGDECLKSVAEAIRTTAKRPRDIVARFGGEEFIILLPETRIEGAAHIAAEILSNVEKLNLEHKNSVLYDKVTVSIGAAALVPKKDMAGEMLLNMADETLYKAKRDGRNCLRIFTEVS